MFVLVIVLVLVPLVAPVGHTYIAGTTRSVLVPGVMGMPMTFHDGLESLVGSGDVLNNAMGTIGLFKFVSSVDVVTISVLVLGLLVMSVGVVDSIFEFVMSVVLEKFTGVGFFSLRGICNTYMPMMVSEGHTDNHSNEN